MRTFWRDLPVAVDSLRHNVLRSVLTLLGIAVGITAVLYVVMLGDVAQARIRAQLESLGANVLLVFPGGAHMHGGVSAGVSWQNLTEKDGRDILARSKVIAAVVPEYSGNAQVQFQDLNQNTRITGTLPDYEQVNKYITAEGRWFTEEEAMRGQRLAVLGSDVVKELFPNGGAVGSTITIKDLRFTVVGTLPPKGSGFRNPDEQVFVPLATAQQRLFGADYVSMLWAQVKNPGAIQEAFFDIESTLRSNHRLRDDQPNDFGIRKQDTFLAAMRDTNQEVARLILFIAFVSLVVGGIGIANVMLVTIVERTREIGVRRAIGAKRGDILRQFLIESAVLGILGGVIGVAGGALAGRFTLPQLAAFPYQWVGYSFLICAGVGIVAGLYPALKAAHIDVIDAIRYE
jgi:putative ABC transport system permease protein